MITIEPRPGVVVVELPASDHGSIPMPEKPHDSLTGGIVIIMNDSDKEKEGDLVGRVAHWRKYKDDARITASGKKLAFIEIKDILGTTYERA